MFKFHRWVLKRQIERQIEFGAKLNAAIESAERLSKSLNENGKGELAAKVHVLSIMLTAWSASAQIDLLDSFGTVPNNTRPLAEAELDKLRLQMQAHYQELLKELP